MLRWTTWSNINTSPALSGELDQIPFRGPLQPKLLHSVILWLFKMGLHSWVRQLNTPEQINIIVDVVPW